MYNQALSYKKYWEILKNGHQFRKVEEQRNKIVGHKIAGTKRKKEKTNINKVEQKVAFIFA